MGNFFITDKGDVGLAFGDIFGMDSSGNVRIRISDHISANASTGELSFNTGWKNIGRQTLIKCFDEEDEEWD